MIDLNSFLWGMSAGMGFLFLIVLFIWMIERIRMMIDDLSFEKQLKRNTNQTLKIMKNTILPPIPDPTPQKIPPEQLKKFSLMSAEALGNVKKERRWFPRFFPKKIQGMIDQQKPIFYDEYGKIMPLCSSPFTHNIVGDHCIWCRKSLNELRNQVESHSLNVPQTINQGPQPDFNSPTTATLNPVKPLFPDPAPLDPVKVQNPLVRVQSYCLKCKSQVDVLKPQYETQETRRGLRKYLKGFCGVCGSKIHAIVKVSE